MLHELTETADAPTFLPLPTSPVGRRVAALAFDDHRNRLDVGELASRAATSVRTVSRLFPVETGLTFKAWRQRARIVRAMDRLARGNAIARVSAEAGFASTAAFSCAFRQVTAMTPTGFLGRSDSIAGSARPDAARMTLAEQGSTARGREAFPQASAASCARYREGQEDQLGAPGQVLDRSFGTLPLSWALGRRS